MALEAHGLATFASPAFPGTTSIATGGTRRLLELEAVVVDEADLRGILELDRLSVAWQRPDFRLVAGRQAITWGVNVFWPVLDLFAPFPPERIDREYKPGVDALRLTVPFGGLSEVDLVGAVQGTSLRDDGSLGALARVHVGPADLGAMAGWFHGDVVVGGFVTADVRGTGLRAEVAFTDSGDAADRARDRASFWRATVGLDRQLTPTLTLTAEAAWNGFGAGDADRLQRGEVTSLGRYYLGASLAWQAHPLVAITATVLANLDDGSLLLTPHLDWSLADNLGVTVGVVVGVGPGARADGTPGSGYGAAADVAYVAVRAYF